MKSAAHQYEDKLLEFAYGELPQHEADAVDAHVRGCNRCAQSLSDIRAVRATMAQLPLQAAPDAGLESLLAYAEQAATRARKPTPSLWKRFLMPLASLAALATVGVIGFRANQEFDTSRASAAADTKLEAHAKVQAEKQAEYPPADRLAQQQEMPSAPIAAPTPLPTPAAEIVQNNKEGKNAALDDLREAGGKRGDLWTPEAKQKATPQSVTRRDTPAKVAPPIANDEQVYRDNDYSNAAARGGLSKTVKAPPPPPAQKPVSDKDISYGLGTSGGGQAGRNENGPQPQGQGTASTGWSPPVEAKPQPAKEPVADFKPREEAKKDVSKSEEERAAPAPIVAVAPMPSLSSSSSYTQSAKKGSKGNLGLSLKSPDSAASGEDALPAEAADSPLGINRDAKFAERQRAEVRTQALESARVASSRGDRLSEVRLLAQVLENGATGYQRVEALKRICDAYEALGEPERADPFCDTLTREFPNTAAAKAVEDRRKRVQRSPAPAPKSAAPERQRKAMEADEAMQPAPANSY